MAGELEREVVWRARDGLSTPHAVLRELPGPPARFETFCGYSIPVTPASRIVRTTLLHACRGCRRLVAEGPA